MNSHNYILSSVSAFTHLHNTVITKCTCGVCRDVIGREESRGLRYGGRRCERASKREGRYVRGGEVFRRLFEGGDGGNGDGRETKRARVGEKVEGAGAGMERVQEILDVGRSVGAVEMERVVQGGQKKAQEREVQVEREADKESEKKNEEEEVKEKEKVKDSEQAKTKEKAKRHEEDKEKENLNEPEKVKDDTLSPSKFYKHKTGGKLKPPPKNRNHTQQFTNQHPPTSIKSAIPPTSAGPAHQATNRRSIQVVVPKRSIRSRPSTSAPPTATTITKLPPSPPTYFHRCLKPCRLKRNIVPSHKFLFINSNYYYTRTKSHKGNDSKSARLTSRRANPLVTAPGELDVDRLVVLCEKARARSEVSVQTAQVSRKGGKRRKEREMMKGLGEGGGGVVEVGWMKKCLGRNLRRGKMAGGVMKGRSCGKGERLDASAYTISAGGRRGLGLLISNGVFD